MCEMKTAVSVSKARAQFPSLLKKVAAGDTIAICKDDVAFAYIVSRDRWEAILETMEIMANPKAMKAIRDYEAGRTKFKDVSCLDEE